MINLGGPTCPDTSFAQKLLQKIKKNHELATLNTFSFEQDKFWQ
jgi:hypothetical protein